MLPMTQKEIVNSENVTRAFVSRLIHGKQHTKIESLAKKIALMTGKKPIIYIIPELRDMFLRADPEMGKKVVLSKKA